MECKEFNITAVESNCFLVTVLSDDVTNPFWNSLCHVISSYNQPDADIYFDYLYRNGITNRFFYTKLENNTIVFNSVRRANVSHKISDMFDNFYKAHSVYIDTSVLSTSQKNLYKRKLRVKVI